MLLPRSRRPATRPAALSYSAQRLARAPWTREGRATRDCLYPRERPQKSASAARWRLRAACSLRADRRPCGGRAGSRRDHQTSDNGLTLRALVKRYHHEGLALHAYFIDSRKAHDSMQHEMLWAKFEFRGFAAPRAGGPQGPLRGRAHEHEDSDRHHRHSRRRLV